MGRAEAEPTVYFSAHSPCAKSVCSRALFGHANTSRITSCVRKRLARHSGADERPQALQARNRRLLAEQLHRLEQRRADAPPRERRAQRAEGEARLEPELLDERDPQRRLDLLVLPVGQGLQCGKCGVENLGCLVAREGIRLVFELRGEEEREQVRCLAEQIGRASCRERVFAVV